MKEPGRWRRTWRYVTSRRYLIYTAKRMAVFAGVGGVGHLVNPTGGDHYQTGLFWVALITSGLVPRDPSEKPRAVRKLRVPEGEYELCLVAAGARYLDVIKELRASCDLTHRAARQLCDDSPSTFRCGATREEAEAVAARLREAGAYVTWGSGEPLSREATGRQEDQPA